MADNDLVPLDLYGAGDIQPYNEGMPTLAPLSPGNWGRNDVDVLTPREIANYQAQNSSPTLFGAALPSGTTSQQINAMLGELGGIYMADMAKLGYPSHLVQAAIAFFMANATKAPIKVRRQHSFKLPASEAGDWLAESFGNHLQGLSGTLQQRQQFLDASLQWLALANKKLGATQPIGGNTPAHGRAPSSDPTDSLTDAEFEAVVKINQQAAMNTEITLRRKWGDSSYVQNVQVAQRYLDSLPPKERQHFEQFTTGWVKALNTAEVIEGLFNMAIGAANIPTSGGGVQAEISQIEALMRDPVSRRAYLKDAKLQARLRTLYTMRDDG